MGRWNIAKRILGCAVAAGLTVLALGAAAGMLQRKDSDFKYRPYFTQEADFDVLFFGTSHVINGIFPMELWKDYGIVSYNFGGHGNELATSYWVMRNALDYTDPKLVVIDGLNLGSDVKTYANFSNIHQSLDVFPISRTKIAAASDLLDSTRMKRRIYKRKKRVSPFHVHSLTTSRMISLRSTSVKSSSPRIIRMISETFFSSETVSFCS